ncbi:MAG TPA: hypothetical protein VD770_04985, partial [Coxiellaceae bacterium]|nr:hypothetical protein [Coxiellaceae bacterium]
MKKTFFVSLAVVMSIISVPSFAHEHNIVGTYQCTGHDPYTPRDFTSTITIQKSGDVYSITEGTTDNRADVAVGLVSGKVLALAYQDKTLLSKVGVQAMRIKHHGKKLEGPWAQLGKSTVGSETCIKIAST